MSHTSALSKQPIGTSKSWSHNFFTHGSPFWNNSVSLDCIIIVYSWSWLYGECNLKTVNFLDVTFDLTNDIYKPYQKANHNPLYINKNSNHLPCILKQLPVSIEKRLSETSSNENVFNDAAKLYNDALKESGFNYNLKYSKHLAKMLRQKPRKTEKGKSYGLICLFLKM